MKIGRSLSNCDTGIFFPQRLCLQLPGPWAEGEGVEKLPLPLGGDCKDAGDVQVHCQVATEF